MKRTDFSESLEFAVRNDRPPPQVADVDVRGERCHGPLQAVVVAHGATGHPSGDGHPSQHAIGGRPFQGWREVTKKTYKCNHQPLK